MTAEATDGSFASHNFTVSIKGDPRAPAQGRLCFKHDAEGKLRLTLSWLGKPWFDSAPRVTLESVDGDAIKVSVPSATPLGLCTWNAANGAAVLAAPVARIQRPPAHPSRAIIVGELLGVDLSLHLHRRFEVTIAGNEYIVGRTRAASDGRAMDFDICGPEFDVNDFEEQAEAFRRKVESLCWVLSFLSGRVVELARFKVQPLSGPEPLHEFRDCSATPPRNLPKPRLRLSTHQLGPTIAAAVDRLEQSRLELRSVIHLLALARQSVVPEVTGLLCANILEVIRYNYLHHDLEPRGLVKPTKTKHTWQSGPDQKKTATFRNVLEHLVRELALTSWTGDIVDWRNQVVHQGSLPGGGPDACGGALLAFVDELVATLLGLQLEPEAP